MGVVLDPATCGRLLHLCHVNRFAGLTLFVAGANPCQLRWQAGTISAAHSADVTDSPLRVAKQYSLLSPTQLGQLVQSTRGQTTLQIIDAIASAANLDDKRRATFVSHCALRAAMRPFAMRNCEVSTGGAAADQSLPAQFEPGAITLRAAMTHMSQDMLQSALTAAKGPYQLTKDALSELRLFSFGDDDRVVLATLRDHALTMQQLTTVFAERNIPTHRVLAIAYSLLVFDCLTVKPAMPDDALMSGLTGEEPHDEQTLFRKPLQNISVPAAEAKSAAPSPQSPTRTRQATPEGATVHSRTPVQVPRAHEKPQPPAQPTSAAPAKTNPVADEIRKMIEAKIAYAGEDGDYYALLGVKRTAGASEIQKAYFALAKNLHPDRLRALKIDDDNRHAHRVFAKVNEAFRTLTDADQRKEYNKILEAGGKRAFEKQQEEAERKALQMFEAEDAHQRGEVALQRHDLRAAEAEFRSATELNPEEGEHLVMYAWVKFRLARDVVAAYAECAPLADKGIELSPNSVNCYMFKGRMAKEAGKDADAKKAFLKIMELDPRNQTAATELRTLR